MAGWAGGGWLTCRVLIRLSIVTVLVVFIFLGSGYWFPWGFPGGSVVKNPLANAGDTGSIPGLGRSGVGNGSPLQYSCLENSMDTGAWWVTVHGVAESDTT